LTDTGNTIDVHGPGAPSFHPTLASETVFTLASVSGKKWKGVKLVKGQGFPHYYGVHPIGWQDYPRFNNIIEMGAQDQIRSALTPVPPRFVPPPITCGDCFR